jgi:LCCL domain
MNLCRLLAFGLFLIVVSPARADEDLPAEATKLIEENEKASGEIVKKAEEILKKAQEAQQKAEQELVERKQKLIAQLEELGKRLEKEGKAPQAKVVAKQVEELKTGRIAGAAPDPGTVVNLRGQNGKVFFFEVTGAQKGAVWGTDVYTDDSSLAAAAVHAGILKVGHKAVVKVTILPGEQKYGGSMRNGITTTDFGAFEGSFKVEAVRGGSPRGAAPKPRVLADPGTMVGFRGQNGKSFLFEITGQNTGSVWGTGVYTDDSSLATAAVHAGIVKVGQKAVIKVTILPGEQQYTGSDRNGITSSDFGDWSGSYRIEAERK